MQSERGPILEYGSQIESLSLCVFSSFDAQDFFESDSPDTSAESLPQCVNKFHLLSKDMICKLLGDAVPALKTVTLGLLQDILQVSSSLALLSIRSFKCSTHVSGQI